MTTIHCYLPCTEAQRERLPRRIQDYIAWQATEKELNPFLGRYHWVLQTQIHLAQAGVDARLTHQLPERGIVYSHVDCFDYGLRPGPERLLVAALVDKPLPLPHAALHLVHNPVQDLRFVQHQHYMPPWSQIGLIPRDPARGDRFETLYFVGNREHLHPFFASEAFTAHLERLGLTLVIPEPARWHDFSGADAVVAIRNFGTERPHLERPALKLFNAWRAGVPAILGYETAYRAEGEPGVSYLQASSEAEVLSQLERLATQPELRRAIAHAGLQAARRVDDAALLKRWLQLIEHELQPRYAAWCTGGPARWLEQGKAAVRERLLWRYPASFSERRPAR